MKVEKLVWSWYDGDGVYTNGAESLENIIEEIFARIYVASYFQCC